MLSVIYNILSIIGIILLVILVLVLFTLLIILFVPITYKISGQIDEDHKNANVKVHWLLGIICFTLNYTEKLDYCLKVLWFDLTGLIKKKPAPEEAESSKDVSTEENQSDFQTKIPSENNAAASSDSPERPDLSSEKAPTECQDSSSEKSSTECPDSSSQKSYSKKTDEVTQKVHYILEKIRGIWNKILYYIDFVNEDDTKDLISHSITVIIDLLKNIRPRKLKLNAEIGFESPDTTGKIYGYLCMLYPFYGENIHIIPDFENKVLKGNLISRGRIFICVIVYNILRILFDKKLYRVIHKFNRGGT